MGRAGGSHGPATGPLARQDAAIQPAFAHICAMLKHRGGNERFYRGPGKGAPANRSFWPLDLRGGLV
ncbi:MAG: hypothetical protein AMJ79_09395 [Phycisphaerae bacterium SM23_30]|nr:MAG: hypothetical protein AMJ79_09395 [Phycisphaerae bacterium SM23_30]